MRRASIALLTGVVALSTSCGSASNRVVVQQPSQTPAPACLHGPQETPEQAARKRTAIAFTRQVNTLQARAVATSKAYVAADQLQLAAVPEGFEFRMAVTPTAYAFSVRDNSDPCRFAYFSDEQGLIFHGEVIR